MTTLQDVLNTFADGFTQGKADPTYVAVANAINSSPDLAQQMTTAIANLTLASLVYNTNGQGGDYNPQDGGSIELGSGLLQDLVAKANSADPAVSANGLSSLVSLLAHETSHSNFSATVANERQDYANTHGVPTDASITQWVEDYRQFGLDDEALANITGWNDAVNAATLANGGPLNTIQIQNLARGDGFAYPMFKLNGDNSVSPISGVTLNADGTIDLNSSLSAVSNGLRLIRPSTETTPADYLVFYTRSALNEAASRTSGLVTVSYNTLGLTVPAASNDLNHTPTSTAPNDSVTISEWLAAGTFSQKTTVLNTDDGSKATFEANASHTGTTLTYEWAVTPDYQQSYEVVDVGSGGDVNFGHVVVIDFDGTTNVTLIGVGDTLNMSTVNVVLTDDVSGTINGDHNIISLHQGAGLDLSGAGNLVKTVGTQHVNLHGDGSSMTLQSPYGSVTLMASHQTLTMGQGIVVAGDGLVGETLIGTPGTPGQMVLVSVQAGNDDEFTIQNTGVYYTGKDRNTLHVSGGTYNLITVGNDSHVDVVGMDGGQVSVTASNSEVTLTGGGYDSVSGSHDTITLNHVSNVGANGGHQTITGSAVSVSIGGDDNVVTLNDGASISVGSGSGTVVNASHATIHTGASDATFNGSYNEFGSLDDGTFTINGDQNALDVSGATINVGGSGNIIDGRDSTVHITSGSGDDLQVSDSTINAVDDADFLLSGEENIVTAGAGTYTITGDNNTVSAGPGAFTIAGQNNIVTAGTGTFAITGTGTTLTAGDGSSISATLSATIITDQSTLTYQGDGYENVTITGAGNTVSGSGGTVTVDGAGNHFGVTDAGIYLTHAAGTTDISGSGDRVNADGVTLSYTGDSATGMHGNKAGIEIWGNNDTVLASNSRIDLVDGNTITVIGAGNTIDTNYEQGVVTVQGANMTDVTTLKTYYTETHANTGYFAIDGENSTFYGGDSSHLHILSEYTNTLYVNNATIDLEYESDLVVYGNNNTFTGGSFTKLTITGTGNSVTTTSGQIAFVGDNTGDVVFGAGNSGSNWSAPDPDLPPGDHGGYHPPGGAAVTGTASVDSLIQAMASFGSESGTGISDTVAPQQEHQLLVAAA